MQAGWGRAASGLPADAEGAGLRGVRLGRVYRKGNRCSIDNSSSPATPLANLAKVPEAYPRCFAELGSEVEQYLTRGGLAALCCTTAKIRSSSGSTAQVAGHPLESGSQ